MQFIVLISIAGLCILYKRIFKVRIELTPIIVISSIISFLYLCALIQNLNFGVYFGVAGRTDLIAEFDGVLSVIDYKTSNRIKKKEWCESYFAQGAFYGVAYEELTKIPVSQVVIIIAVDNEQPQLFVEKRDDWVHKVWEAKKLYELNTNDTVEVSG